ncbi:MAG: FAD-binding protein [Gammaproteobacteria bacterium]|nr:FAD-binding protein [Gammaproteobacteria bacterium]
MTFEERLARLLPPDALLTSVEAKRPYECDGLSAYRGMPRVVCLPETREQVQAIVKLCAGLGVPLVPRGAGTGLSGGALPDPESCLLSLAKFDRILDIDADNRLAVVEPGVRNLALSEAVAPLGLYYAPDPSSQIACTIGGNVAENSGGVHCLKYGLTVHNVLGVKILTADGEWLEIGGRTLDAPGYDLLALMNGSEGLLGIVMEATVKLLPKPELARVLLAAFDDVEAAGRAVAAVIERGIIPAGLEMMDRLALRCAEDFCRAGYPRDAAAILLCELDGTPAEVEADLAVVEALFRAQGATEMRVSRDEAERMKFWLGRKSAFPAIGRIAPDYYCMDGTIPRRELPFVLKRIAELSNEYGLPVANVFHAGDGNLHPLIAYDANVDAQLHTAERLGLEILRLCVEVGGTVTGEHGVGVEKLDSMCLQFSPAELATFHAIKAAFDPQGILNPGKAIPTLHRCAEFGAMHVHGGKLPFPELERF